jgi:hypothetical protein
MIGYCRLQSTPCNGTKADQVRFQKSWNLLPHTKIYFHLTRACPTYRRRRRYRRRRYRRRYLYRRRYRRSPLDSLRRAFWQLVSRPFASSPLVLEVALMLMLFLFHRKVIHSFPLVLLFVDRDRRTR